MLSNIIHIGDQEQIFYRRNPRTSMETVTVSKSDRSTRHKFLYFFFQRLLRIFNLSFCVNKSWCESTLIFMNHRSVASLSCSDSKYSIRIFFGAFCCLACSRMLSCFFLGLRHTLRDVLVLRKKGESDIKTKEPLKHTVY